MIVPLDAKKIPGRRAIVGYEATRDVSHSVKRSLKVYSSM